MKRFLSTVLILIGLFTTSYTIETAKEYEVSQELPSCIAVEHKTTSVYVTDFGKKYHEYGCRYLQYSCIEKGIQEAIEKGFTPCSICVTP